MKLSLGVMTNAVLAVLLVAGCAEENDGLGRGIRGVESGDDADEAAAMACAAPGTTRSYELFDGTKLEAKRLDEQLGMNRARIKPYAVLEGEYQRVLGLVPPSLKGAADSFDDPPLRWYAEAAHSGVSLNAFFAIAFEGCGAYLQGTEFGTAPTAESAREFCGTLARKAWSRTATPTELDACASLATDKLGEEPDARKRWSYVCASVLSSSNFLTY